MTGVVEGKKWLEQRLGFLRQELDRAADDAARAPIQAEIAKVEQELGHAKRGWRRFWIFGGRLPGL